MISLLLRLMRGPQGLASFMLSAACLALAACGGSSSGDAGNGGGSGGGGPPPSMQLSDDVFVNVSNTESIELDPLANDTLVDTLACVMPGKVGASISVNAETGIVDYLAPTGFVGTDHFGYVAQDDKGNRKEAAITVRVDDLGAATVVNAATAGNSKLTHLKAADEIPVLATLTVNEPMRIEPVPEGRGRAVRHRLQAILQEGASYRISVDYNTLEDPPANAFWTQYALVWLTDAYSANLLDACIEQSGILYGYSCIWYHIFGLVEFDYQPSETQTHNLYISSAYYDSHDTPTAVTCDMIPSSHCGYDVLIEETDDNRGTTDTRRAIGGSPVHGSLESFGDHDWFRLNVYATETTTITVNAEEDWKGRTLAYFVLRLHDDSGVTIAEVNSINQSAELSHLADADETLYVSITTPQTPIGVFATGGYRITSSGGDVPGNASSDAVLVVGDTVQGRINRTRDADWYRVYLNAYTRYEAAIDTVQSQIATPLVAVFDRHGGRLFSSSQEAGAAPCGDCPVNHRFSFIVPRAGYYYLAAGASGSGQFGIYELGITPDSSSAPADDYAGDNSTVAAAGSYYPVQGELEQAGDADWFEFFSDYGDKRVFYVDGASTGVGTLADMSVTIVDSVGTVLASGRDWDSGGQVIEFTAANSSTYYLVVQSGTGSVGTYAVLSEAGDANGSVHSWSYIGAGGVVDGSISSRSDGDWYRVELRAEQNYRIDVTPDDRGFFGAIDRPVLQLRDARGEMVQQVASSGGAVSMMLDAPASGRYFLAVYNDEITGGGYKLSVTDVDAATCAP